MVRKTKGTRSLVEIAKDFGKNPVRVRKLPGRKKYRVYDGKRIAAFSTTKAKAEAQARLLRGVAHGMVPRSNPAPSNVQVGDHVVFSKRFLQSIGAFTGPLPFARGQVEWVDNIAGYQIVYVHWVLSPAGRMDYRPEEIPEKVIGSNLTVYDPRKGILENPLTQAEYDNIIAEAQVHERIPKTFYKGEASGMRDIAEQYRANPRTKIYNRCIQIWASKEGMPHHCDAKCKAAGHRYTHKFSKKACIYGLPDGSILIK